MKHATRADGGYFFIFTTDHPTAGKGSCHLGKIPLISCWSGHFGAGKFCSELLAETGFATTILNIAGCEVPPNMELDGASLRYLSQHYVTP